MNPSHSTSPAPVPPAGRPRNGSNRDLLPHMTRRVRNGREYFYARFPGCKETYLGNTLHDAIAEWHKHWHDAGSYIPNAFTSITERFRNEYLPQKAIKTQQEYQRGIKRLDAVFGQAPIESIRRSHVAALRDSLRDTPFQANRLIALLSSVWNWAREHEITTAQNPCADVKLHKEHRRKIIVTAEMFYAVYEHAAQELRDWMRLDWVMGDRVNDCLRLRREQVKVEKGMAWLYSTATKTNTDGRIKIEGDLAALIDELTTRKRNATGPYLIQTDDGQRVTYAMLRNRFDAARIKAKQKTEERGEQWTDWQMRDIRKASLNTAATLEEARRRGKHLDARTTARHYELIMNAIPASLPERESTDNLGQIAPNYAEK